MDLSSSSACLNDVELQAVPEVIIGSHWMPRSTDGVTSKVGAAISARMRAKCATESRPPIAAKFHAGRMILSARTSVLTQLIKWR